MFCFFRNDIFFTQWLIQKQIRPPLMLSRGNEMAPGNSRNTSWRVYNTTHKDKQPSQQKGGRKTTLHRFIWNSNHNCSISAFEAAKTLQTLEKVTTLTKIHNLTPTPPPPPPPPAQVWCYNSRTGKKEEKEKKGFGSLGWNRNERTLLRGGLYCRF